MAFEDFSNYIAVNCSRLNPRVPDKKDQEKYVHNWQQRYAKVFKEGNEEQTFIWNIRVHKALKEVFTSASFYQESLIVKESKSWASFYFLNYYSLFHALLSCIYLIPEESIDNLPEITHSKVVKVFKSHFCDKKPHIIDEKIVDLFYLSQFLREYYSYNLPPNDFMYGINGDSKPDIELPYYLESTFQLASFLSELLERACGKHGKEIKNKHKHRDLVTKYYCQVNSSKHPATGDYILHYVDKVRMRETLEYPAPVAFVIELEHFTDEFRNYEGGDKPIHADGSEINTAGFVYRAIR